MLRPWRIWLMFGVCLAVVIAAVGWMSVRALEADDAEAAARRQAALEENAQLALWRMDSAMAPLVAQESARPYLAYQSFSSVGRPTAVTKGKVAVMPAIPSPLLADCPKEILLHFQIDSNNHFSSPRVPDAALRSKAIPQFLSAVDAQHASQWLDRMRSLIRPADFRGSLPALEKPPAAVVAATPWIAGVEIVDSGNAQRPVQSPTQQNALQQISPIAQQGVQPANQAPNGNGNPFADTAPNAPNEPPKAPAQQLKVGNEFNARSQYVVQNYQMANALNSANREPVFAAGNSNSPFDVDATESPGALPSPDVQTGMMKPIWISDQLILARRVRAGERQFIQGCLLDWPAIQSQLLDSVKDLLPGAKLFPVRSTDAGESAHLLASLPVRLELGDMVAATAGAMSPVRLSLVGAWGALVLAAIAVAALLQGVVSLSERRAAFVSAVTHELRTPLTTFRMYAEMLADNMVPEESRRKSYLETLRVEADRLTHLVENVLLYARLERGRPAGRISATSVSQVIEHSIARLTDRAVQAKFSIAVEIDAATRGRRVLADPAAVEQILFNLVDNACKYAAGAQNRALHVEARYGGRYVELSVRDHGPGDGSVQRRVLFQPFRKSAQDAAATAPGVGLGLALCRRLARDMGGELLYNPAPTGGACFTLRLRTA
jgi:signal transduction histidine kinase